MNSSNGGKMSRRINIERRSINMIITKMIKTTARMKNEKRFSGLAHSFANLFNQG
jgi:hypothetical protein